MIYQVFAYKDRRTKAFTAPILDVCSKDNYIQKMKRAFAIEPAKVHAQTKDLTMYYLGTYDDTTGLFALLPEKEFILEVSEIDYLGGNEDGISEKPTTKEIS